MRIDGQEESSNIEDRRGQRSRMPGGKGGGIIGLIIVLIGAYYGVDLSGVVGAGNVSGSAQTSTLSSEQETHLHKVASVTLRSTEKVWASYFAQHNAQYKPTIMALYTGGTHTACGTGQATMGPFYCPGDQKIYLDLSFYEDMKNKLGAGGDAAFAYVIAHEVGHHIQNITGTLPKVHQAQQNARSKKEANALSVRLELQADCYAGIWAKNAQDQNIFEAGDAELAISAAESVGDDRLQKRGQGYAVPDSFTHGSSEQRMQWFQRGFNSGDINQCNTFASS